MNKNQACEFITHRLNGELSPAQEAELDRYLEAHPELCSDAKEMEHVWNLLPQLSTTKTSTSEVPPMQSTLRARIELLPADTHTEKPTQNVTTQSKIAPQTTSTFQQSRVQRWLMVGAAAVFVLGVFVFNQKSNTEGPGSKVTQMAAFPENGNPFPIQAGDKESPGGLSEKTLPIIGARLMRSRGLVLYQAPKDNRWHLLKKGQSIAPGQSVRIPLHSKFGATLTGPHGSTLTCRAGSHLTFEESRKWTLLKGAVFFEVAKHDSPFIVQTPNGESTALGTAFALYVTPKNTETMQKTVTVCEVEEGRVRLQARKKPNEKDNNKGNKEKSIVLVAGASGLLDANGPRTISDGTPQESRDWLTALQAKINSDENVARLVANAGEEGKKLSLEIGKYHVDVTVVDGVARTFMDMTFLNHTNRRLEGIFYYSLPADATISQFQMYVGDKLIVGEVLERHRARQIFEYIRREQRDPALLEWVGGNLFKMRVFPIEPNSAKRIQLGYTQILPRTQGQLSYTFPLVSEMLKKNPLKDLKITSKILSSPGIVNLICPTHTTAFKFSDDKTRAMTAFTESNYTPSQDFKLTWSVPDSEECRVLTSKRADEPDGYFMIQVDPRLDLDAPQRPVPECLMVVIDDSASVEPQQYSVAVEFASAISEMTIGWNFNLGLGRSKFLYDTFTETKSGEVNLVYEFLKDRVPLGGTDLVKTFKALALKLSTDKTTRLIYVGDGIDSLGSLEGAALVEAMLAELKGKKVEISCVAIGSSYNKPLLSAIAARTGGTFRAVEGVADVFVAADGIVEHLFRPILKNVELAFKGVNVAATYPQKIGTLAVGDTGLMLGRILSAGKGTLRVSGQSQGQPFQKKYEINLQPKLNEHPFIPRLWAKAHLDHLFSQEGLEGKTYDDYLRNQIIATSIHYQIMSPYTSFLVLESEEDYKRFGVTRRMRMVDWRGEVPAAKSTSKNRSTKTPSKPHPKITPTQLKKMLLPEPPLFVLPREQDSYKLLEVAQWKAPNSFAYADAISDIPLGASGNISSIGIRGNSERKHGSNESSGQATSWNSLRDVYPNDYENVIHSQLEIMNDTSFLGKRQQAPVEQKTQRSKHEIQDVDELSMLQEKSMRFPVELEAEHVVQIFPGSNYSTYVNDPFTRYALSKLQLDTGTFITLYPKYTNSLYAQRAILTTPNALQPKASLMYHMLRKRNYDSALRLLKQIQPHAKQSFYLWLEKAWIYHQLGKNDVAYLVLKKAEKVAQADPKKNALFISKLANELVYLGKGDEASEIHIALARKEKDERVARSHYRQAFNVLPATFKKRRMEVINEWVQRGPKRYEVLSEVARCMQNVAPEKALQWADKAEKLDPSKNDLLFLRISLSFKLKKEGVEAWVTKLFKTAKDANQAIKILGQIRTNNKTLAQKLARDALLNDEGPAFIAVLQQIYNVHSKTFNLARERILKIASQSDFPATRRMNAFNALHRYGKKDGRFGNIIYPLILNMKTIKDPKGERFDKNKIDQITALAVQAITALNNHGYQKSVQKYLSAFSSRTMFNPSQWHQLTTIRWRIQFKQDPVKATAWLFKIFKECDQAQQAYQLANNLVNPLCQTRDFSTAVEVVVDIFARFPTYHNNQYLYRSLVSQLNQQGQSNLLKNFHQKVNERRISLIKDNSEKTLDNSIKNIQNAVKDMDYRKAYNLQQTLVKHLKAEEVKWDKKRTLLKSERDRLSKRLQEMQKINQKIETKKEGQNKKRDATKIDPLQEEFNAKAAEWRNAFSRHKYFANLRLKTKIQWAATAAKDHELRAQFLLLCDKNAKQEDPIRKEWNQACLACLRLAGEVKAYGARVKKLHATSPKDPIWLRMMVNILLREGKLNDAEKILIDLSKEDPNDFKLGMSLYTLRKSLGKKNADPELMNVLVRAFKHQPYQFHNLANQWRNTENKELAILTWRTMQKMSRYENDAMPIIEAGRTLLQLNRTKEAITTLMRIFEKPTWAVPQLSALLRVLKSDLNNESTLILLDEKLKGPLVNNDPGIRCAALIFSYFVKHHRGDKEACARITKGMINLPINDEVGDVARNAVEALYIEEKYDLLVQFASVTCAPLSPPKHYNVLQKAMRLLLQKPETRNQSLLIVDQILALSEKSPPRMGNWHRQNELFTTANELNNFPETAKKALDIYRSLLKEGHSQHQQIQSNVIALLLDMGNNEEAFRLLKTTGSGVNGWRIWNAFRKQIQIKQNAKGYAEAAGLAMKFWDAMGRTNQGHGSAAFQAVLSNAITAHKNQDLPEALKTTISQALRDQAKRHFEGGGSFLSHYYVNQWCQQNGMLTELEAWAEAAISSNNTKRVKNGAQFFYTLRHKKKSSWQKAKNGFKKLLALPENEDSHRNAISRLYSLYIESSSPFENWDQALNILHKNFNRNFINQKNYLTEKVRCLYKLHRNIEAADATKELLSKKFIRQNYWEIERLAGLARSAKDYLTEIRCLELALRVLRSKQQGKIQPSQVTQFYTALAAAFSNLNKSDKAIESYLRGMSLLNRHKNPHQYRTLRMALLNHFRKTGTGELDAMVLYYEKHMRKKGEMPNMRITFGDAYHDTRQEQKALEQYAIAADLLPKDMNLRQQVISGYKKLKLWPQVESAYMAWAKKDPQNINIYQGLGALLEQLNRPEEAMQAYETMAEMRPRESEGHHRLAKIYAQKNRLKEAITSYRKAVRYRPIEHHLATALARILKENNQADQIPALWTDGERACRQAIKDLPDDPLPWLNLTRFLATQDRNQEARALCKEILNKNWPRFKIQTLREARKIQEAL